MSQYQGPVTDSFNTTGSQNHNTDSFNNNRRSFNTINITVTNDRAQILTWLSPLEPRKLHYDLQTRRVANVGDWVMQTEEFRSWKSRDGQGGPQKATIFCYGNPGVGKTHISSLVIDTLCGEAGGSEGDIAVACFYFEFAAQKEQSAATTLAGLLRQVVSGFKPIPEEIMDAFEKYEKVGQRLQLPEIVKLLGNLASMRRTFFCLDALDECAAPDRAKIFLSLKDIIKMSSTTRVFLTGRPHVDGEVGRHFGGGVAGVLISPRKDDIIQYIHAKLAEDATSEEMDEGLEAEILQTIPETVAEIFLLVSLNLEAILQETSIHRRREKLRVITDGQSLEDAYGATLERIKALGVQRSRLGIVALMWVCHSERPLGADDLCQALAVEIGVTDCNPDKVSSIQTVLSCCQGLITVDKGGSTVRLIHHTLQEYLTSHRNPFRSPHSIMAETCLTYLNSQQIMALSGSHVLKARYTAFLQYSALFWGAHMKKEPSDRGKALALELFTRYRGHISIKLLLDRLLPRYLASDIANYYKFTGLHYASIFGLSEVVRALTMIDGVEINDMDETGATPLLWAVIRGHVAVVKLLLGCKDVNPDMPDNDGRTPISWAVKEGHVGVIKLLLGRKDVNPDMPDHSGQTLISWAAENGREEVVKLLLGREDVNPDKPDKSGRTPILWAARNGHEAVVKLLLGREDVNPYRPEHGRQEPLWWATKFRHRAVVRLPKRKGINADRPDI